MTTLEINNIDAQRELMSSIIGNYDIICRAVRYKADDLMQHLSTAKVNDENKTLTLSKEDFGAILNIVNLLQTQDNWGKLNSLASIAVPENKIKLEVLRTLQK
jgi:hypothetical protein